MKTYFELIKESKTPEEMELFLLEYEMYRLANCKTLPRPEPDVWLKSERNSLSIFQDVLGVLGTIFEGETDES